MKKENIRCPTCGKENTWVPENSFRPFCNARCKLIDLGAWAAEDHKIPGEEASPFVKPDDSEEK